MKRLFRITVTLVSILSVGFVLGYFFNRNGCYKNYLGARHVYNIANYLFPTPHHFYNAPQQGKSEIFQTDNVKYPYTFIVYGDTQEPARDGRELIVSEIVKENSKYVIRTGDLVAAGNEHQWRIYDYFEKKLNDNDIPVYPVLGNHEYAAIDKDYVEDPGLNLQLYFKRFLHLNNNRWYTFRYGNVRFIMMDTNTDYSMGSEQYRWLISELRENDSLFKIMVFHHPPHTISYMKLRKEEQLITKLIESNNDGEHGKVDIVFSGHVHNYERYKYGGVNYVVSGGGGAFPHLLTWVRKKEDIYNKPGAPIHYCRVTVYDKSMVFEMVELNESTNNWQISDEFIIDKSNDKETR